MRFGFVGPSYTVQSGAVSDSEAINLFAESNESGALVPEQEFGGRTGSALKSYYGTPGLSPFASFAAGPVRGSCFSNNRLFIVADTQLIELSSTGGQTIRGFIATDSLAVSIAFNAIQILIVGGGRAYCFTLATNVLLDVTAKLAGIPVQCDYSDTYFVVCFQNSNKYQISQVLDGNTWPGLLVNQVSVFADNIVSIIVNHREPWVFGAKRAQPYQDTGSLEVFDVIGGALIETGSVATFSVQRVDNSVFWVGQDERGAVVAFRSNGYTPTRISTHAVEVWFSQQANIALMTTYSYQDRGHLFWVIYVPGGDCSWVYDVGESMWHKRASWDGAVFTPHWSWNHVYAFGLHLVGDWNSGTLYQMNFVNLTDNGTKIRRLRRAPTVTDEMRWMMHSELRVDFETGLGPQPPFVDGNGAPRAPQAMLRWSDDRGKTWSNVHTQDCGMAGKYNTRVIWRRLGRSRYRVYELSMTDPIAWTVVDAYLEVV